MNLFLDSLVILLNISNSYSIIPYLLFFQYYRAVNTGIITGINVLYILYRFSGKIDWQIRDPLFLLFLVINVLNICFGLMTDTFGLGMLPFIFANTTFYILLYNLFKRYSQRYTFDTSFWLIIRGYIWFSAIAIASILTLYCIVTFSDFNPLTNSVNDRWDLFRTNVGRNVNVNYYFPLNVSILQQTNAIKIGFLQVHGIITGLFHEGHTGTLLYMPSIFLIIHRFEEKLSKIVLVSLYILVGLIIASTTNLISISFCILVFVVLEFRTKFIIPVLILILAYIVFLFIDQEYYAFIIEKINSRSADYSLSLIYFAFTPKTLIGTNFFNVSYWDQVDTAMNVGWIIFFLNIAFLTIMVVRIIKINSSKDYVTRFAGLFVLYFFLHSMKVTMSAYSLSYLVFVLFVVNIYTQKISLLHRTRKTIDAPV